MRYTEARMSKIALEMLRDINKNTVDFQGNYDDSEQEPVVLPARFRTRTSSFTCSFSKLTS